MVSGGVETSLFSTPVSSAASLWLQVQRSGTAWTVSSSSDGVNYTGASSFTQNLTVSAIGVYAWNYNGTPSNAVQFNALVDYFHAM
jgi:hypothetical protein